MTLSELCECDAETLEKISDAELLSYFKEHLTTTRPEMVALRSPSQSRQPSIETIYVSPAKKKALEMLAEQGIDMSFLNNTKRRK